MGVNPRGGEESERGALDGRGKGKAGEVGWGDKEDGDRLKEKVAEIRWLIPPKQKSYPTTEILSHNENTGAFINIIFKYYCH